MAAIFQTTFSNAFSWMKMYRFRLRFHWSLFPRGQLTVFRHWFRECLVAGQATTHYLNQLDESTARRQLKSPRSLFDLGHQMVMVMVMNDLLPPPLCNVNRPSHSEIQLFQNLTMKIHGQGHVCGQKSKPHLTFKIQRSRLWSRSNPLVTFEAWNSIDMFAFRFMAIGPLLADLKEIPYLTLKI